MSPHLFEIDLLERRRLEQWRRLARPDDSPTEVRPPAIDFDPAASEPFTLGYPRHHLLARALLPLALAILLFLSTIAGRSNASHPRGPASSELLQ